DCVGPDRPRRSSSRPRCTTPASATAPRKTAARLFCGSRSTAAPCFPSSAPSRRIPPTTDPKIGARTGSRSRRPVGLPLHRLAKALKRSAMDYTENRGIRPAAVDGARTLEFVTSAASAAARHPMTDQLRVLQSAIAVAPCGMAVCNRFGRLLLANRALGEIFGYAPADLLPRNLRTIIPDIVFAAETPG